ncbi:hypothetical protein [Cellulosimicrobium cellulans]|uniref:hypothetical protein n=1 Tax=Cellulosimicrobium cellulans TaxID=1710 RepID=UPI00084943C3|nr:hypothetical protein [Cellulosimicrobium cellulans]
MSTSGTPDALDPRTQLARAAELTTRTRAAAWRWVRIYLSGWAASSVALVAAIGLGGRVGMVVGLAVWGALVAVGVTWARRQGFALAVAGRRIGIGAGLWAATYGALLAVGLTVFAGDARYWVPAAVVSAVPLLAAAWWPAPAAETAADTGADVPAGAR